MTTVNTIEQKILQMDGGEFQKLCDAYLSMIGYGRPNSFGAVAGSNKVKKGTPDTFFERPNGKLVFAEATNQKDGVFKKLSGDLANCLNEKKTKVPAAKIEEIVFCYTSQLAPNEVISLKEKCEKKNVKLTLLGISKIANDLLNYPILLRHFLNLNIDTGQIIPLEAFPSIYGKSKFATTLETNFHFREGELNNISTALENFDLVVVSGKSGVGKSRLALEVCRNFISKHSEFKAYSIVSQSQNLYDDLTEKFSQPGQYLILVDDANRVSDFSYFMHFLRTKKDKQRIKIIVTVRDYALDKITKDIFKYPHQIISLERLTNDQIKEFSKTEFGILNPRYLERIEELSVGNPRIAVMISKIAVEKNSLDSINDVSSLYEEYFSSIKEDLKDLENTNLLKVAGVIAFLRSVDRTNEQMMSGIWQAFGIPSSLFWEYAFQLHEREMVDMYENEVVRISDQVLSTYLFYSAFFKEKVLDFSTILQDYFPQFHSKLIDALNPTLSAFNENIIFETIRPKVQKMWDELINGNDEEKLLALSKSFWFLNQDKVLSFIKSRLLQSKFAPADLSQLDLDENQIRNASISTEIQLLGYFRHATPELQGIALKILVDYLKIRPAEVLQVLHVLVDDYSFDRFSNDDDFSLQEKVIDILWDYAKNGEDELYSRLFIAVSKEYLKVHFQTHESKSNLTVTIYSFVLQPKHELFQLRTKILNYLIALYPIYSKKILDVFAHYIKGYHQGVSSEIISNDSFSLLKFIHSTLNPESYLDIIFINEYLDFLEDHSVSFDVNLRNVYKNDTYTVYQLLLENRRDFRENTYDEFIRIRNEHFASFLSVYSEENIRIFIDHCVKIESDFSQGHIRYEIVSGFGVAMSVLAENQPEIYKVALDYYLRQGEKINIHPLPLVKHLMNICGKEETYNFIYGIEHPNKRRWLFGFYQNLTPEEIRATDLSALYSLFQESDQTQIPKHLDSS